MSIVSKCAFKLYARFLASVLLCSLENLEGIEIRYTLSDPRASTARHATNAESIPPLKPITAFL